MLPIPSWVSTRRLALLLFVGALISKGSPRAHGQAAGRMVFVANNGNLEGSVSAIRVAPDGMLSVVNRVITGSRPNMQVPCPGCNPYEIELSPDGTLLATGHASSNDPLEQLTFFRVAADGSIAQVAAFSVPGTPMDVAWLSNDLVAVLRTDPNPDQLVVYRFDPNAPGLEEADVVTLGGFCSYLVTDPSRRYLYANDSGATRRLFAFRAEANGQLTLLEEEPAPAMPLDLAVSPDARKLYAAGGISGYLCGFHVAADGLLTSMAGSPFPEFGDSPSRVAVNADSSLLLAGHGTDATMRSARIDPDTGALTYTGHLFDVGLQGTLGDVATMDNLCFVTDNSTAVDGKMGIYSFVLGADGSFTMNGPDLIVTQGVAPRAIAAWRGLLGDLNCDGTVDFGDINPFVLALAGQSGYEAQYPGCVWFFADCNSDGRVDFGDINAFVQILSR